MSQCRFSTNQKYADMIEEAEQAYWARIEQIAGQIQQEVINPALDRYRVGMSCGMGSYSLELPSGWSVSRADRLDRVIERRHPQLCELVELPVINGQEIGSLMADYKPAPDIENHACETSTGPGMLIIDEVADVTPE